MGIGFTAKLDKKVDVVAFIKGFGSGESYPVEEVVKGFEALIESDLIGFLDPAFVNAANNLVVAGMLKPPGVSIKSLN